MDKTYERDGVRNIVRELRTEVTGDYEATFRISYEDFKVTLSRGQHCCGSMQTGVKAHAKEHNSSQHCCVLLGVFGQQCCIRLHWPKSLTGFKLCATSANKCQQMPTLLWFHANGRNMLGPTVIKMLLLFAWALTSMV